MVLSRRTLIGRLAGATVVAVGGTPLLAFAADPAAPWASPGALAEDARIRALEWAVLVPNPHNRQPWLVELVGQREMRLLCDLDRRLPMTDPFDRQITIGLGCFLEMFVLAAAAHRHATEVTLFPDGAPGETERLDARPVAHLSLAPAAALHDPLFAVAPFRRTNKAKYDGRVAEAGALARIAAAASRTRVSSATEPGLVKAITDIAYRAGETEFRTARTRRESIELMRIGRREIEANPDGIDIDFPGVDELVAAGTLTREAIDDPASEAYRQAAALYAEPLVTTTGWIVQESDGNGRAAQVATGRDWLRVNLAATAAGLSVHPYSQALQEFPEVAPMFAEMHELVGVTAPVRLQMLARVGYGPDVPPSPRWPARSRILT